VTVAIVGAASLLQGQLRQALPDTSLFAFTEPAAALDHIKRYAIDVVIWATPNTGDAEDFVRSVREVAPTSVTVVVADGDDEKVSADFVLPEAHTLQQLGQVLRRAFERHRLLQEITSLRTHAAVIPEPRAETPMSFAPPASDRLLKEFTRILAAGFDLPRTLEMFVDGVVELLRPARVALLLPDQQRGVYRVRVHRGLVPQIAESVRLAADRGLGHWLAVEGRPARVGDVLDPRVVRDLALLQGNLAVPLLARGDLVAILVVGPPLVRNAYAAHEVETLFDLASHLASAVHGITLHQRLQSANQFNAEILEHMASGVVTIGADERIGILNRRAAEILDLEPRTVVGEDLRALPSPLGDMLYETLTAGRAKPTSEIRLALRGLWLQVSTYPVQGERAGAVLVFDDLTAQKELAERKRETELLDLLTRVIARIADEIKNPLVSINTFMELIGERFDDADFRREFSGVVSRDVRRLVQVFEKLTGLVAGSDFNFSTLDIHTVVEQMIATVEATEEIGRPPVAIHFTREPAPLLVKVDPGQLRKALSYLVWYLAHHSPERTTVSVSIGRKADDHGPDDVRVSVSSRTAEVPAGELERIFDPVRMVQENVIDIGPAVSQRIVEALGGRLELRHARHDIGFVVHLPASV
jgi:nitrogen-specific signal transduction histidine kinase